MTDAWDGRPEHPERDGWHWLKHPEDLRPFPSVWNAELHGWPSGAVHSPQGVIDLGFIYLGPCLTTVDVAARIAKAVAQEREATRDTEQIALGLLRENVQLRRVVGLNADWTTAPAHLLKKHSAAIRARKDSTP